MVVLKNIDGELFSPLACSRNLEMFHGTLRCVVHCGVDKWRYLTISLSQAYGRPNAPLEKVPTTADPSVYAVSLPTACF